MKIFKNSITAKVVTGFLGLALAAVVAAPAVASAMDTMMMASSYNFTKTLKVGTTDQEVWNLQTVLNMDSDTVVSTSGAGSKGMETKYFGAKTKKAVVKFQEKYASDILIPNGLSVGTGLVGASTRKKLNGMGNMMSSHFTPGCSSASGFSMTTGQPCVSLSANTGGSMSMVPGCTGTTGYSPTTGQPCSAMVASTTMTGTGVTAMLDVTSPMASTLITPQGVATFATFKLSNPTGAAVKVTMLKFKRTGISSDSTINNAYLYQGSTRLTDSASVSQGNISFSDATGLVTIPAMSSVMVSVRGDIASGMNGQTIGVMLTDATTDGGTVGGLPVSGAQFTLANAPTGMASADFTGATIPATISVDPQTDLVVWQKNLNIGNRDAQVSSIRFQQIGSVYTTDLGNFRLMIDGVQVGTAVVQADANRFVTFAWANPMTLKAGNHTVKLMTDVISGSSRTLQFSLRRVVDVEIWDSQLGVVVTPTVSGLNFSPVDAGVVTLNAGTLTITKDTTSPSGNVVLNGSNVTLAKFSMRAAGENLKVENLTVGWTGTTSGAKLRSGALYADGVQIGSTQDITVAGTVFNLGSSLIIPAGKTVKLEVRGDVFNNGTGGALVAGDTITVSLIAGSSNVYKQSSLGYMSSTGQTANQLSVQSGTLAMTAYSAYSNQTVTAPQTAYKVGEYRVTSGNTEGVNLDTVTLALTANGGLVLTNVNNLYVVYNSKTSQVKATAAASQTFSINEPLAANGTMSFAVYADFNSSVTSGQGITSALTVSGTSQSSGNAVTSTTVTGQTITVGSGVITVAADASTPVSALVVGNSTPKVGSFKFTGLNDSFTIDELTLQLLGGASDAAAIQALIWKDGAVTIATTPVGAISGGLLKATSTGLTVAIGYNQNKVLDVYAQLGNIGTGGATSSANVGVALNSFEYLTSSGQKTRVYGTATTTNAAYAFKTKPTITNVALPTTVLANGTQTVYQYSVTADAGGTVGWRVVRFNIAETTAAAATFNLYDSTNQSTVLTTTSCARVVNVVTCTSTIDQEVSGSMTYVLKATVAGAAAGASISVNIPSLGAFAAPNQYAVVSATNAFIWSDESVIGHSATTADWMGDYLVKTLPTDSLTMTK